MATSPSSSPACFHCQIVCHATNLRDPYFKCVWRYESIGGEVTKAYQSMVEAEGWQERNQIDILECHEFMLNVSDHSRCMFNNFISPQFTLCIISKCGFGIATSWHSSKAQSDLSETFNFSEALRIVSQTLIPRIVLPNWVYSLPING